MNERAGRMWIIILSRIYTRPHKLRTELLILISFHSSDGSGAHGKSAIEREVADKKLRMFMKSASALYQYNAVGASLWPRIAMYHCDVSMKNVPSDFTDHRFYWILSNLSSMYIGKLFINSGAFRTNGMWKLELCVQCIHFVVVCDCRPRLARTFPFYSWINYIEKSCCE